MFLLRENFDFYWNFRWHGHRSTFKKRGQTRIRKTLGKIFAVDGRFASFFAHPFELQTYRVSLTYIYFYTFSLDYWADLLGSAADKVLRFLLIVNTYKLRLKGNFYGAFCGSVTQLILIV